MVAPDDAKPRLERTALHDAHQQHGAKLMPFGGYEMPLQYDGLLAEHRAVRKAAGLFDVSHMGQFELKGEGSPGLLDEVTPSNVSNLPIGRALYTVLTTPEGTILDDVLVYKRSDERLMVVVNAANRAKDLAWIETHAPTHDVTMTDLTQTSALLALQGPRSREILATITTQFDPLTLRFFRLADGVVAGRRALFARTGYTGEIGFEIFLAASDAAAVWHALLDAGRAYGLVPAGLGARDSLRLEAGLPLYGADIDETTDVLSAGLEFVVDWDKPDFVGRGPLAALREQGPARRRCGFVVRGRGIARPGHAVFRDGVLVGKVTSGTWSPTLEKSVGMSYLPVELAQPGTSLQIDVRGRQLDAEVAKLPFYHRKK